MQNGWTERIEELEAEVAKLTAERDADRRREYGYSQQTVDALTVERDKLEAENKRLRDEIRDLEWKIYRPLKEGEMTQEGDQVLGPEEDAKWVPVTGNYRLTPSALYPAHCHYRRLIVDEIKKEMEGDYFYRKCVAGKESARSKRIKKLEAEIASLRLELDNRNDRIMELEEQVKLLMEERENLQAELKKTVGNGDNDL